MLLRRFFQGLEVRAVFTQSKDIFITLHRGSFFWLLVTVWLQLIPMSFDTDSRHYLGFSERVCVDYATKGAIILIVNIFISIFFIDPWYPSVNNWILISDLQDFGANFSIAEQIKLFFEFFSTEELRSQLSVLDI